ncbi:galactose-binding domain-containing protein [Nonomuraea turcica]|uniref:galactose-binding domain-containing protein n=1 Tax=Nonomuraea sp. G32 TaxID=3067274 RepID=UPI00273CB80E|nr:discoidin domain-containing protein [Nonomuraea sp. G32]MDP4502260.1 discoidin domain-containing protein [Nonomuraea sp. G32]
MRQRSLLALALLASTMVAVSPAPAQADSSQWQDIRRLLSAIDDAYTAPPAINTVQTTGYTSGLLLGNGDLHVAADARDQRQTYYLSKSDFWHSGNGQMPFGKISISPAQQATAAAAVKDALECTAACVIDGDPETRWVSQTNASAPDPQWVTVDLGQAKTIDRWVVRHNGYQGRADNFQKLNTQNFALQKSADGATWTDVDVVTGNTAESTDRTVPAFTARYVRLHIAGAVRDPADPNQKAYIRDLMVFNGQTNVIDGTTGVDPNYLQRQDLLNAEVQGSQTVGGQVLSTRSWTADGENLLVTELSIPDDAQPLPLQIDLTVATAGTTGVAADGQVWITRTTGADGSTGWASKAAASVKIVGSRTPVTAGTPASNLARLSFELAPGRPVRLVTSIHGNGGYANPTPLADFVTKAVDRVAALDDRALDRARGAHREWWKQFWLKSYVDTGDSTLNKFYYGALYAMGAASREGFFLPGTYSPWRTMDQTGGANRYWMNYNTESQYYGVYSSNRPELAAPYYKAVWAELPYVRNTTHAAGYKGMTFSRTFSPYNATRPAPAEVPVSGPKSPGKLSDQKTNGTFAAIPFMWNWEYTRDEEFLRTRTYPFLKELGEFWMDFVVKGEDGKYHVLHSAVNEGGDDVDSVYDLGYIRRTLTALIEYSKVLGVDAELRPLWQSYLDDLAPYPTATMDGLDVILLASKIENSIKGNALLNKNDQPINLEGVVHPSDNLAIGGDPEQLRKVRDTLQWVDPFLPGSRGSSINGFPKTFTIAARAGWDPEDLIGKFSAVINRLWRPNLTVRQGGGAQETSGSLETVNSMFLQTFENVIRVFPAWPAGRDGKFVRLRAKGAFLVSAERKAGREVSEIEVTSEKGGTATLASPWRTGRPVVIDRSTNRPVPLTFGRDADTGETTFSFPTRPGRTYRVSAR